MKHGTVKVRFPSPFARLRWVFTGMLIALAHHHCAPLALADKLTVAGDGQTLWIARPEKEGESFTLYYREESIEPADKLLPVDLVHGQLIPGGFVAGDGRVWLIYQGGNVQFIRVGADAVGRLLPDRSIAPALPDGVTVRSLAANAGGLWALVRIENAKVLEQIDAMTPEPPTGETDSPDTSKTKDGGAEIPTVRAIEPAESNSKNSEDAKGGKGTADKAKAEPVRADRLIRMLRDRWVRVPLPEDWPAGAPAWLVMRDATNERPDLVVVPPGMEQSLRWYQWRTEQGDAARPVSGRWSGQQEHLGYTLNIPPVSVDKQIIVARRLNEPKLAVALSAVLEKQVNEIGTLAIDIAPSDWRLIPVGKRIALIAEDDTGALTWRQMSLRGEAGETATLTPAKPTYGELWNLLAFLVPILLATPVLIVLWKRDPHVQSLELPEGVVLADMGTRFIAGMIDLAPCIAIAAFVTGTDFDKLISVNWPGRAQGWEGMIPGVIAVSLFIGHTFLGEVFTARTLGKALTGLRVAGMKGQPPDLWQALARNIFKALDLIIPPLLIFAILGPHRQRLGDMIARTVVTAFDRDDETPAHRGSRGDDESPDDDGRP